MAKKEKNRINRTWLILSTFFVLGTVALVIYLEMTLNNSPVSGTLSTFATVILLFNILSLVISSIAFYKLKNKLKLLMIIYILISLVTLILSYIAIYAGGIGSYN